MNETKKFRTLGASMAFAQANRLVWYTNCWKYCNYDPIAGLKAKAGDDVKYVVTEVGETYQIFYGKKGETKNEWLRKKEKR